MFCNVWQVEAYVECHFDEALSNVIVLSLWLVFVLTFYVLNVGKRIEEASEEAQCPQALGSWQTWWCLRTFFLKSQNLCFNTIHYIRIVTCCLKNCFLQAPKPSSGPHKSRECLPLVLIIRNKLKYALTYREVISILMQRHIQVDGKVRTDKTYPAGFMGTVS